MASRWLPDSRWLLAVLLVAVAGCQPAKTQTVGTTQDDPSSPGSAPAVVGTGSDSGGTGNIGGQANAGTMGNGDAGSGVVIVTPGGPGGSSVPQDPCMPHPTTKIVIPARDECGDGLSSGDEECDDGNQVNGDGCTAACRVEDAWQCVAGCPCRYTAVCADGVVNGPETCDDGNLGAGDGCSSLCEVEVPGWLCRVPGKACEPRCGDGLLVGDEECDDGNTLADDGCSPACRADEDPLEDGGVGAAACGDGAVTGGEECDDGLGNADTIHGACGTDCAWGPVCGDGVTDSSFGEECDLGLDNTAVYGQLGCTPGCTLPHFCGDGIIDGSYGEQCDDATDNGLSRCRVDCLLHVD